MADMANSPKTSRMCAFSPATATIRRFALSKFSPSWLAEKKEYRERSKDPDGNVIQQHLGISGAETSQNEVHPIIACAEYNPGGESMLQVSHSPRPEAQVPGNSGGCDHLAGYIRMVIHAGIPWVFETNKVRLK
jgi:hypothetical protein